MTTHNTQHTHTTCLLDIISCISTLTARKRNIWMLEKVNVMSTVPKWPTFNLKSEPLKGTRECHKHLNTHSQITELIIFNYWSCMNQCCESISMAATSDKKWRSGWLWRNIITLFAFVSFWWLSLPLNLSGGMVKRPFGAFNLLLCGCCQRFNWTRQRWTIPQRVMEYVFVSRRGRGKGTFSKTERATFCDSMWICLLKQSNS